MLLALDVGNSNVTAGLWRGTAWIGEWRIATDARRTAAEYGLYLDAFMTRAGFEPGAVRHVVISSVVPELDAVMVDVARGLTDARPLVVRPGTHSGLDIVYNPPSAVGSDRLAACAAAAERFGVPSVVVDFGTATTISVVDARARFVGGAIAPGVGITAEALARAGARLSRIALAPGAIRLIGRTTAQSMRSGALLGHAAAVEHLLAGVDDELAGPAGRGGRPTVVATGGWSGALAPLVRRIDRVEPRLVLDGLRLIWQREQAA